MDSDRFKHALSIIINDSRSPAYIWVLLVLFAIFCFFFFTKWSYLKLDVLVIWILSCLSVLMLSNKIKGIKKSNRDWILIFLGIFLVLFSFLNIYIGFGNPPYSIGDFSIFLSGISLVYFGVIGIRILSLPAILPAIAVIGFQIYEKLNDYFQWFAEPLIPPIVVATSFFLQILNINYVIYGNTISFISSGGENVNLIISTDCTGIWSLGTFTISCIIILFSFPEARTGKSYFFILIGYLGTFITNILRVWFIVLIGYYWGTLASVKIAHDYFGWLIFSFWVIIFWYFFIVYHLDVPIFKKLGVGLHNL